MFFIEIGSVGTQHPLSSSTRVSRKVPLNTDVDSRCDHASTAGWAEETLTPICTVFLNKFTAPPLVGVETVLRKTQIQLSSQIPTSPIWIFYSIWRPGAFTGEIKFR